MLEEKASAQYQHIEKPTKDSGNISTDFSRPWIRLYISKF